MSNKKTKTKTNKSSLEPCACGAPATPELPTRALLEITNWMLDYAEIGAHGDPADLAAIARVRRFLSGAIEGKPAPIPSEADVLTVAGLSVTAFEHRNHMVGLGEVVAGVIDATSAPTVCGLSGRRLPRIAPHLYCMP